uniref:guanylate kinase n=2 Tax=Macrostomum lignano TaxID=282301 RepID=A0A1I8HF42_9PLAT
ICKLQRLPISFVGIVSSSRRIAAMSASTGIRPIVFSGPSGSGKSTLIQRLMERHPGCFRFCVSHTTRQPRAGEKHGQHYWYVTEAEMLADIDAGKFIESTHFAGNRYGTSYKAVTDVINSGQIPVLDVDVQGVKSFKAAKLQPPPTYVYIKAPSMTDLEQRLRARCTDDDEKIRLRLAEAEAGNAYADQAGAYDVVIVNDNLDAAFAELDKFLADDVARALAAKASAS